MIWNPKTDQRVRLHYRKESAHFFPHHGKSGIIIHASKGGGATGPINAMVLLEDGTLTIVPRGNLIREK
jgi:hypothetical protein